MAADAAKSSLPVQNLAYSITAKIAERKRRRRSPPSWAPPRACSLAQGASRHGGYGHLTCALLLANLDLTEVVEDAHELWARKLGLQQRCQYVAGDMFEAVPKADAYSLKMILHDCNDAECIKIPSNIRKAAAGPTRASLSSTSCPSITCLIFPSCSTSHDVLGHRPRENRSRIAFWNELAGSPPVPFMPQIARGDHHRR